MTRITGDDFMLIGLQTMAADRGDGVIPDRIDMVKDCARATAGCAQASHPLEYSAKLIQFPGRRNEPREIVYRPASNENNVIAFPAARRRVVLNR